MSPTSNLKSSLGSVTNPDAKTAIAGSALRHLALLLCRLPARFQSKRTKQLQNETRGEF
jgi:hypothetical protein